jgi:hypothetical protein
MAYDQIADQYSGITTQIAAPGRAGCGRIEAPGISADPYVQLRHRIS